MGSFEHLADGRRVDEAGSLICRTCVDRCAGAGATPVAVASGAIEASVMGEGEGSGGGDGGARGALSPVGGSKGPEPLASPSV